MIRRSILSAALLLPALLGAGCSAGPESPEALFEAYVARMVEGDFAGTWPLLSEEGRKRWVAGVEANRDTLRRNPNNPKIAAQYQVTDHDFMTRSHEELWRSALRGTERVLLGARITQKQPVPGQPGIIALDVETALGQTFRWHVHEDGDRGWRYRDTMAIQLEAPPKE